MPKITFDFNKLAKGTLHTVGHILVEQGRENMDKTSYGRVYIIGGRKHIASRSGDTANNLSGALRDSIRYELQGNVLEFGAGNANIKYAKYLENGTKKIDKRPNYTKSLMQNKSKIDVEIKKLLKESLGFK